MATISEMAKVANGFLIRTDKDVVILKDDRPDWVQELCHSAHGDMLPDDWRYEFIQDALNALEEDEDNEPDVDNLYPYNADRLDWLSSNLNRAGYCDEAMEEIGGEFSGIFDTIAIGMQAELREVFALVRDALDEQAIEQETEPDGVQE